MTADTVVNAAIKSEDSIVYALASSSTKIRINCLFHLKERIRRKELPDTQIGPVLRSLFQTHPYYIDRPSRAAVRQCIGEFFVSDQYGEAFVKRLVPAIKSESLKPGIAASNAFVLLEWTALLLEKIAAPEMRERVEFVELLNITVLLLDNCLGSPQSRASLKAQALRVTRRGLRTAFKSNEDGEIIPIMVDRLVAKNSTPTPKNALLLGIISGVSARLPKPREVLIGSKKAIYAFYVREILGSRVVLPPHIACALDDFFISFATVEEFETELLPSLERGLLRSPEVVLNDLVTPLIRSLPSEIDLSKSINDKLLTQLLSCLKSTNHITRNNAVSAFKVAMARCRDETTIEKIVAETLNPLKGGKVSSADQRILYAQMLSSVPSNPALSKVISTGLSNLSLKEPNESVTVAVTSALVKHLSRELKGDALVDISVIEAVNKGLSDKRANVRRAWFIDIGNMIWDYTKEQSKAYREFCYGIVPKLLESFSEALENPIPTAQSGLIVAAYVTVAVTMDRLIDWNDSKIEHLLKTVDIAQRCLTPTSKLPFLLNYKAYSKLSTVHDHRWAIRALAATSGNIVYEDSHSDLWASAFLYLICAAGISPECRKDACGTLTKMYKNRPEVISKVFLNAMWDWVKAIELADKDTPAMAAKTGADRLKNAILSLAPLATDSIEDIQNETTKSLLVGLTVLCHHELIPGVNWISLCQRAGVDPGQLVSEKSDKLVDQIRVYTRKKGQSPCIKNAALKTAATLAFVSPTVATPLIVELFESDLDPEQLRDIGRTEVSIWGTSSRVAFIDVLSSKTAPKIVEKSKDADTLKWEAEVRSQLAKKNGTERKLTSEEKARVDAQLVREAAIRERVENVELRLGRGVGIIHSLAEGAPTAVEMWMNKAVRALLKVLEAGAGMIVRDRGIKAYLACAEHVSQRLGVLRSFIGITTLRALDVGEISSEFLEEDLGALAMRLLYRLRVSGEQRPFDITSLFYILPLILLTMSKGGIGSKSQDDVDEQIVLALDFISFHTEVCSNILLPRDEVLQSLIVSMQKYSALYKPIRDCFFDLCRCISNSITPGETNILITGTINSEVNVRAACLQALDAEIDLSDLGFSDKLWLACHDEVEENVEVARTIWEENGMEVQEDTASQMISFLGSQDKQLRGAASRALSAAVQIYPHVVGVVVETLIDLYREKARPILPQYNEYGMMKKVDSKDPWEPRSGVALAFKALAKSFDHNKLTEFSRFLVQEGTLADKNPVVREEMIEAATATISAQGALHVEELMETFEATLEAPDDGSAVRDRINEAVIILYGALGRHLGTGDLRIGKVVDRLLATLSVPSETVQYAVAECLPPLIKASRDRAPEYLQETQTQLFTAKSYASRRGAAYGLAGIIKGCGISALKDYRVMQSLKAAIEEKKNTNSRQGALFAFELLSLILGRVFEPYVIQILPMLLSSFGDPVIDVREACADAAKVCFSSLSSYGVKIILPHLLEGLDDTAWRSKKGACETLGAMAYLAPHQLAISLPDIIPPLTTVLNDSHKEVRAAANRSLKKFGEVISNPEIRALTSVLLKALSDPTKYTDEALDALLKIQFVHYLDSPSLALVARILERGLSDRSATKRKSAQIIGSLAHLTERKDLMVHIPILVTGLKQAIVDPVPATRATASKALGSLIEKLGEDALPDIIPGLMATLKSDTGAGDRLGSAQALSEVLSGLGTQRLEETLPTILQNASSSKPSVREGFMSLFIFLPACFGNSFSAYLSRIIPSILSGLADDVESIRETSLRAGRLLVKNFATRAIDLLLPELERGLADANHRIRLSSVELVGDLLFNLTGISGKPDEEEEEETSGEISNSLLEALGQGKRDKVLSALYICRCDTSGQVRLAAVGVWKALVSGPKTLKELVPALTQLIIKRLGSSNLEQRVIASQALGELIRKAGEGVLSTLLPSLDEGLQFANDSDSKQGICIALKELVSSTAPETLEEYEATLVSIVRRALVDSDDEVREASADAFECLQRVIGKRAVDQVLPHLLNLLQTVDEADNALAALLTLLTEPSRSNIILPILIPTLLAPPITRFNAKALASLARVAGSALNRRLPHIMNSLFDAIISCKNPEFLEDLEESLDAVILSVDEVDGLSAVMSELLKLAKHDDHLKRATACRHFAKFFSKTPLEFNRYNQDCVRVLLISFGDPDTWVVKNAWEALNELTHRLKKEELEALVFSTRQVLQQVGVKGVNLPGFLLPKGINSVLPIFLQGLLHGTAEQRTQSALAVSDIIDRTSVDSLRPYVTQITGSLIRVISERSVDVKAAILLTLNTLLMKVTIHLKPFLPQLQRTFAKCLADTSSELLRTRAARALGTLITLTPRIDPLIVELVAGAKVNDPGVCDAMMKALCEVVGKAGENMGESSKDLILALVETGFNDDDDHKAITGARLLGFLVRYLRTDQATRVIKTRALSSAFTNLSVLGLNAILAESPAVLQELSLADEAMSIIIKGIAHKTPFVSENCALAAGKYLLSPYTPKSFEMVKGLFDALSQTIRAPNSGSNDTKRLALVVVRTISRTHEELIRPHLPLLAPAIFSCVRDVIIPVKLSAEQAFTAIFQIADKGDVVFEKFAVTLEGPQKRSMVDYFKRVAVKLAAAEKERNEAGGAGVGLKREEDEDLREIMSVGKVDLDEAGGLLGEIP